MKKLVYLFTSLIIYTTTIYSAKGQELSFQITSEITFTQSFQDSLKVKKKHKDYRSIATESLRIEKSLRKLGYLENKIDQIIKLNDTTYITNYKVGQKSEILKIYFNAEDFNRKELLTICNTVNDTYFLIPISETEKTLSELNTLKTADGNAFATLKLVEFKRKQDTLTAFLLSHTGIKRQIDSVVIKGYEKFPQSFIHYFAGIKKGMPFNRELLLEKNNLLNSLNFTTSIKPPEILFEEDKTSVYLYLEKQNSNQFDGILGFASKEDGNGLELNGYLNLELTNNLNYGETLSINYKADGEGQRNFQAETILPYILKTRIGLDLHIKLFRRDSTFSTNEQQIKALFQINPATKMSLGYKSKNSSNLQSENNIVSDIQDYDSNFIVGGFEFNDYQNSPLFPIKCKNALLIEIGTRKTQILKNNQTQIQNIIYHIFNLNKRNSLFLKNNTSILISEDYLTNELFRFGGINTIRGFNENSIDASLYSILNTEYRYLLSPKSYIHSIVDLGYFQNELLEQEEKLYSFGIGIGLQTKAGILKFNFANGNIKNQDFKFSNSKIHFSLVTNF